MTVRAKFQCSAVIPNPWGSVTVHMHAVYGNGTGNEDFTKATPCGNLNMVISDDVPASKFFSQGKNYFLDFTESE